MTAPHLEALALAQETRSRRAALKRHLQEGRVSLAYVLRANKNYTRTMPLRQLLLATPNVGPVKANRVLSAFRIGPATRLEDFPMQRREQLLAWLSENCPRVPIGESEKAKAA